MLRTLSQGVDVCLTATLVDGLVLARSIFNHSVNYRSVIVLGEAPSGQEGVASASLQLAETLGVALGAGFGGVLVAAGAAAGWLPRAGIAGAFAVAAAVALLAAVLARRIPRRTIPAPDPSGAA
jgi:predicted MFS family arabinose efflux permease